MSVRLSGFFNRAYGVDQCKSDFVRICVCAGSSVFDIPAAIGFNRAWNTNRGAAVANTRAKRIDAGCFVKSGESVG